MEFKILKAVRRVTSKLTGLGFRRVDFGLFKYLLGTDPRDKALERRGALESCLIFKDHFLQAQENSIPVSRTSGKNNRRPVQINKELLAKPKHRKEAYRVRSKDK